jgi:arsenate reductase-like glutaredoxin family protein
MLVFVSSCGNIYKKPLTEESRAQIIQEINTTLNEFFKIINTEPENENLEKVVSNETLLEEIIKSLAYNPDRLVEEEIELLNLSINIVKLESNLLTADVSGELSNKLSFSKHRFVFRKQDDGWKIDYF